MYPISYIPLQTCFPHIYRFSPLSSRSKQVHIMVSAKKKTPPSLFSPLPLFPQVQINPNIQIRTDHRSQRISPSTTSIPPPTNPLVLTGIALRVALMVPLPLPPVPTALIIIVLPFIAVFAVIAFASVSLVALFAPAPARVAVFVFGFAGSCFSQYMSTVECR